MLDKNIVFVIGGLGFGGQERALSTLANSLADRGYRITIICLFLTPIAFPLRDSIEIKWPNVDRSQMNKLCYALRVSYYLRTEIKKTISDVIVSFGDWYNTFTIVASLGLSRNVYVANRMGPELRLGPLLDTANRLFYRLAKGIIVQTERAKCIVAARYSCKSIAVVPNAVEMYPGLTKGPSEKIIISVGRLSREKGHATLVRAFSKIEAPNWQLHLIGDGPERARLENLVKELGIDKKVCFFGAQINIWRFLAKAEIFVLPSFYEGFPNALVEAMSVPLCCVASDCVAGPREILSDGETGFLVEPGNVDDLARILERLVDDPEFRAQIAERSLAVRKLYGAEEVAERWLKTVLDRT